MNSQPDVTSQPEVDGASGPTADGFDQVFSSASAGVRRVWQLAEPDLPPEVEPFSFVSVGLLRHVLGALGLAAGEALVDLACGRGGPGLWLAREADASLTGVDYSPVGVSQATDRAALFGLAGRARFVVGDLADTGLAGASADAVVCVDAFHFAADPAAAAAEARRILRCAGFTGIEVATRPEWHDGWTRVYQVAIDLGDPGDDTLLASLQDESRKRLRMAAVMDRVVVTATAP